MRRRLLLIALVLCALAGVAFARPGGGESFSGGGGHSSGGGSGGGEAIFELIYWTIRLTFYYPQVGLPLLGGILALVIWSAHQQRQNKDWDSGPPVAPERAIQLDDLRRLDPDFSQVLFEDFAFRLFSAAHRARGSEQSLAQVAPYVSKDARGELAMREPIGEPIVQVIVGAMRVVNLSLPPAATDADGKPARVRIALELEANTQTSQHTYYSVETWLFGRDATRTSKPPGASKGFPCPNCGAPWQASATGTQQCASCGQIVDNGRFDWLVERISLVSQDERPPTLTTEVPERGTDLATYRQPGIDARWQQLLADDPALAETALRERLGMIYSQLNTAWSNNDLKPVRGLVSDGLYDYLQYWIDAYKRQGLRNALVDMRLTGTTIAKVVRDRWYDAVTVRIWGKGKDYVVRSDSGRVVRGSKHTDRAYSEYWTLIRSAARKGAARTEPACSNCGAPLHITMSGECEHCGAHVTSGEFDWVVSKIEQDDTYRG
ncbi:MAG: TIM44-like domain-containing protein [Acidobacteriota bacterium]